MISDVEGQLSGRQFRLGQGNFDHALTVFVRYPVPELAPRGRLRGQTVDTVVDIGSVPAIERHPADTEACERRPDRQIRLFDQPDNLQLLTLGVSHPRSGSSPGTTSFF